MSIFFDILRVALVQKSWMILYVVFFSAFFQTKSKLIISFPTTCTPVCGCSELPRLHEVTGTAQDASLAGRVAESDLRHL